MEVGADKCGILLWTQSEQERAVFNNTRFRVPLFTIAEDGSIADVEIPKVEHYKYLGIVVDNELPNSREQLTPKAKNTELRHAKSLALKGRKALHAIRPVLTDRFCPLPVKVAVIRTFVASRLKYGAELLGFKQEFIKPQQRVLSIALRWAVGLGGSSREVGDLALSYELGIPTLEEEYTGARTRLWTKAKRKQDPGKTFLPWLAKWRSDTQKNTWMSLSQRLIKTYASARDGEIEDLVDIREELTDEAAAGDSVANLPEWALRGRQIEAHVRSNKYTSTPAVAAREALAGYDNILGGGPISERRSFAQQVLNGDTWNTDLEWISLLDATRKPKMRRWEFKLVRSTRDNASARQMKSDHSKSWEWYDQWAFGYTRGYLRTSLTRPDLREGVRYLVAIRTNWFPTVERRWAAIKATGGEPRFAKDCCPLCKGAITSGWEWAHLMIQCSYNPVELARKRYLRKVIMGIAKELESVQGIELALVGIRGVGDRTPLGGAIAIILAGGTVGKKYGLSYTTGYGQGELLSVRAQTYGFVYAASFLTEVAVWYTKGLDLPAYTRLDEESRALRLQDI